MTTQETQLTSEQIARMQQEHAAMKNLLATLQDIFADDPYTTADKAIKLSWKARTLLNAIDNTPTESERIKSKFAELNAKMADEVYGKRIATPQPAAAQAGDGLPASGNDERYIVEKLHGGEDWVIRDTLHNNNILKYYPYKFNAKKAADGMNKRERLINAANGSAAAGDTVAGSGNAGGE